MSTYTQYIYFKGCKFSILPTVYYFLPDILYVLKKNYLGKIIIILIKKRDHFNTARRIVVFAINEVRT
jgi:hypothetical protein